MRKRQRRVRCHPAPQRDLFGARSPVIVAWGAGVDSTAMIIEMVRRGERIDLVLFADAGSEHPDTYAFIPIFRQWLTDHEIPSVIVRYEVSDFGQWPAYRTLEEECLMRGLLPSKAFGFGSCSKKWKIVPQERYIRSWQPALDAWGAGLRVVRCIGFDCSPADSRRYIKSEGRCDPLYQERYPLREWGWTREDCAACILRAGLPLPPKSACVFCPVMKPHELLILPILYLRRIVLMEARAKPNVRICGLWRAPVKGLRGATPRPGSMTEYIRDQQLLPAEQIDRIITLAAPALAMWLDQVRASPGLPRPELSSWLERFDKTVAANMEFASLSALEIDTPCTPSRSYDDARQAAA